MRISIESAAHGLDIAREVSELVAPTLGWSEAEIQAQINSYIATINAEMAAL